MPLQQDTIDLIFSGGLDTKTDPRQVPLGKFLVLQNMVFSAPKKIVRRNGYTALTSNILGGSTISSGSALSTRANELLLVDGSTNFYSYDQSNTAWNPKGILPSISATVASAGSPQYNVRNIDMAVASNGLACLVYELSNQMASDGGSLPQGVAYSVIDTLTGQIVVPPTAFDSTAQSINPRVVVLGTNFAIYWMETDASAFADIYGTTLSTTAPLTALPAKTKLSSGSTTLAPSLNINTQCFDAKSTGAIAYIQFTNRSGTPGTTIFRTLSASPTTVSSSTVIGSTSAINNALVLDPNGNVVSLFCTATNVTSSVYNSDLSVNVVAPTTVEPGLTHCATVTGIATAAHTISIFYSGDTGTSNLQQYIRTNTLTTGSYTVGSPSKLIGDMTIGGQAFLYSGAAYLPVWHTTASLGGIEQQSGLFILDSSGNMLASALTGSQLGAFWAAGAYSSSGVSGTASNPNMVSSSIVSGTSMLIPASRAGRIVGTLTGFQGGTSTMYQYLPVAVTFNFSDTTNSWQRVNSSNYALYAGSLPYIYDGGVKPVEQNFIAYPGYITASWGAGGSQTTSSTYNYYVCYEWVDAQGQVQRSAPGPLLSSQNSSGTNTKAMLTIPTLRTTQKTNVFITVYRTVANGTVFYQVNNLASASGLGTGVLLNDKTVDSVTWADGAADSSITANPQLYTTGGVLADGAPPPLVGLCTHRNRVFGIDPTTGTVWYTKLIVPPVPPEWSPFNTLTVDQSGGFATALGSLDDKLIIFKPNRAFYISGQGPDNTGGQNDFSDALPLPGDIGCPYPKSVVQVPGRGLMFQSQKGWYLLDRGLGLTYIGADVEGYNAYPSTSAQLIQNTTQIRWSVTSFDSTSASQLVYDYYVGQWSIFTSASKITDAAIWSGQHVQLQGANSTALVFQEAASTYNDADSARAFYAVGWTTPWIHLKNLQGYQRLFEFLILGKYVPDNQTKETLRLQIDYNYDDNNANGDRQTVLWGANNSPSFSQQIRIRPLHPRRESIKITLLDFWDNSTTFIGSAMEFSGLTLRIGISDRPYKLAASATYG